MSSNTSPIDRECTSLYSHFVVNFAISHTLSEIFAIFCQKSPFHTPPLFHPKTGAHSLDLDCWDGACGQ